MRQVLRPSSLCECLSELEHLLAEIGTRKQPDDRLRRILEALGKVDLIFDLALAVPFQQLPNRFGILLGEAGGDRVHFGLGVRYGNVGFETSDGQIVVLAADGLPAESGPPARHLVSLLREIQARLGHTTVSAAMRYQAVAKIREDEMAARLSALAVPAVSRDAPKAK